MAWLASALIRLYPREWRGRYGLEMAEMIALEGLTLRSATDLVAGAIDARLNPQLAPAAASGAKGHTMTTRMFRCSTPALSSEDYFKSAAWMVGASLALVLVSLGLQASFGRNSLSDALNYGSFPAALMLSNQPTYLKPYSRAVRLTLSVGGAVLILLMMWASVVIGGRI